MRVFFVRTSDNGNYGIEAALAESPRPPACLHTALFRGFRVPLEPMNFDPGHEGFAWLNSYDLVILAGLDPVVLSPGEHLALVAFVERGGGLLLVGGSHSFGNAEGTWLPLEPILPVRVLRGLDVQVNAMPGLSTHPIARGLPAPLGYVGKVHPVEPRPDAQVAMKVNDLPLVVAGEYGYGRVAVLASYPECDESEYGWFFTGDAFNDFLRNAVGWLCKEREAVWFESFSLPNRRVVVGNEEIGRVKLAGAESATLRLVTRVANAEGRVVDENTGSTQIKLGHEGFFSFRVPDNPAARGVHHVTVAATDATGDEAGRRDVAIEVVNPTRVTVAPEYGRWAFLPGEVAHLRLCVTSDLEPRPAEVAADLGLLDLEGRPVLAPRRRAVRLHDGRYEDVELAVPIPRLRCGRYRLRVELRVGEDLADAVTEELDVVAPPDPGRFPLIAEGGYHLDRPTTEAAVARLVRSGANTLSVPGPAARSWGESPHWEAMLAHTGRCAAREGAGLAHHHSGLVPGLSAAAPLAPCPLTPEFRNVLEKQVRPLLAASAKVPSLCFHEMVGRAAVAPTQVCRCPACLAAFQRNFNAEMPPADAGDLDSAQRRLLAGYVTSYWWHVFSMVQKLRDEAASRVRLSLTLDASSFLRDGPQAPYCDALAWARACDVVEVAAEATVPRFRLSLAGHRALAAGLGKSFGAQIALGEDALPVAEAAYTALAHGAAFLHVAGNPRFLFFGRQRPLEDAVGDVLDRLGRVGPLLAATARPPARVALLFPFSEMAVQGSSSLLAAFELLQGALGNVDLLHERLATEDGLAPYGVVAILEAGMHLKRAGPALVRFVERGGLLLADRADITDDEGVPVAWPEGFFGTAETPVFEAIAARRRRFGSGRTLLFSADVARAYQRAVERGDRLAVRELRRAVRDAAAEHGVRPWARSSDPEVEVGLRACDHTWLVVAVNHNDETRSATIELDPAAVPASCAFDLATGESLPVETGKGVAFGVRLGPRDGGVWALYPERPFTLRVECPPSFGYRGGALKYRVMVVNDSGHPAQGCHIVRVSVTDAAGDERREHSGDRATRDGVLEVAEPFAVNERVGRWTLAVTDPLTRRVVRRAFDVTEDTVWSAGFSPL